MYNLINVIEQRALPVGTNRNVRLEKVEFAQDSNWTSMQLTFSKSTPEGNFVVSGKFFEPNGAYPRKDETKQDAIKREIREFNTKLKEIAEALLVPEAAIKSINSTSFAGIVGDFKNLVTPYMSNEVCLKVVANKKNYSSLPSSGKFIFPMARVTPDFEFTFKDSEKIKDLEEGILEAEQQLL